MEIRVLAFGVAKEIVGSATAIVATQEGITVGELLGMLGSKYPELSKLSALTVAVNGAYAGMELVIKEHDEVAMIPPVSGG